MTRELGVRELDNLHDEERVLLETFRAQFFLDGRLPREFVTGDGGVLGGDRTISSIGHACRHGLRGMSFPCVREGKLSGTPRGSVL